MKEIGEGYYYKVYDLGNGRVRKIPRGQLVQIILLFKWYSSQPFVLLSELKRAPYSRAKRKEEYEMSKKMGELFPEYFGNPVFDGYVYEQDKALPLKDIKDNEEFFKRAMKYTNLIHALWRKGVGERVFNFTLNAGINEKGELILLDTNEFTFDGDYMRQSILSKRFTRASSFLRLPEEMKSRIYILFEREFSIEKFEEFWNRERKLTLS